LRIITKILKQKCVYWSTGEFDEFGQPSFGPAVELKCRWVDQQQEVIKKDGTIACSRTAVNVESDVVLGGVLMKGELADVEHVNEPTKNAGAFEILRFDKVPDIKGSQYIRVAYLK